MSDIEQRMRDLIAAMAEHYSHPFYDGAHVDVRPTIQQHLKEYERESISARLYKEVIEFLGKANEINKDMQAQDKDKKIDAIVDRFVKERKSSLPTNGSAMFAGMGSSTDHLILGWYRAGILKAINNIDEIKKELES